MRNVRRRIPVLFALALLGACTSTARYPGSEDSINYAILVIDNSRANISSMTVDLVPVSGQRRRLGIVNLNEVKEFTVNYPSSFGQYQLFARADNGTEITSRVFNLIEGDRIRWDLRLNSIQFDGNSGGGSVSVP